jgi:hypothetical protein
MKDAVRVHRLRAVGLAVAALVGRDDAKASVRERSYLMTP